MSFNDGSCKFDQFATYAHCWNGFSGTNILAVRNTTKSKKRCEYLPTGTNPINGNLIIHKNSTKAFISHDQKIVVKVQKRMAACDCTHIYETNFPGIFLYDLKFCALLTGRIAPMDINVEHMLNIKLDYSEFRSENSTRFIYNKLYNDISHSLKQSLKHFFTIAQKSEDLGIFEISEPFFGNMRGDVISVLHCKKQRHEIVMQTEFCTKELQVYDSKGNIIYIPYGSKISQKYFQKRECFGEHGDLGTPPLNKVQEPKNVI